MKIIAFTGFARVGKTTAAKYLEDKYGFKRHNFKDALVAEIRQNFPDLLRELSEKYTLSVDELFEQKPLAMRALLQNYGTEVRRKDDPYYWTRQWAKAVVTSGQNVVVDDTRYLNEAQCVINAGGKIVRLTRPDVTTGGNHISETEQLQITPDATIECEAGDLETLYRKLDEVMAS